MFPDAIGGKNCTLCKDPMASGIVRLLARTLRDVTSVRGEDLRSDRAEPLENPSEAPQKVSSPAKAQVVCVASGKGGTGKTVVTTNLAAALSGAGLRVTLLDADMGLANAHMLMGVAPEHDVSAVLEGQKHMPEIAVECEGGAKLVAGGTGLAWLSELPFGKLKLLADEIALLEEESDLILVDLAAGIGPQVMRFLAAAHSIVLVTTPDPTALLDAYATIKSLCAAGVAGRVRIVVNRARDRQDAIEAFKKIQAVAARQGLSADISFFGWVPHHWFVQESVAWRRPVVLAHPRSAVAQRIFAVAEALKAEHSGFAVRQNVIPISEGAGAPEPAASFASRLAHSPF